MNVTALEEVIRGYQQAVALNPNDARAHHHLAMYYSQNNNYAKAIEHFNAALIAQPTFLLAHYHAGLLFFKCQQWEMAKIRFCSVLELDEKHIPAHFYMGILFLQEENLVHAEQHFQAILSLDSHHVQTLINLGVLELKRDAGQEAVYYFTQALVLDENNIEARRNLAATFMHYDRFENALTHYYELEKNHSLDTDDYYNMGVATMSLGLFPEAIDYYEKVLMQHADHMGALNNLAAIYIRQGKRSQAILLLHHALKACPENASSQFMLSVLEKHSAQPKASQEYVKNLFDNYAINYDQHMQKILTYSLPEKAFEFIRLLNIEKFQHVLDLGCGTGLSGIFLRDYCEKLTGVDLSKKMLSRARNKNIYDDLIETDIISFLHRDNCSYDIIQALDVLPYFGALNDLFDAIILRLSHHGFLLFSAEMSEEQPWKIQDSMRFCHHPEYIKTLLESRSMRLLHHLPVIARQENGQDLYVSVMLYQKIDEIIL